MIFATRFERELSELHALIHDLDRQLRESLEQIQLIREAERERTRAGGRPARPKGAGDRPSGEPLLAFVHIPKTAGKTVTTMLVGAYSKPAIRDAGNYLRSADKAASKVGRQKKARGRVIVGHVPYGLFRENLPPDTRYMTFLREPIDRVVSHFWRHIRRNPDRASRDRPGRKVRTDTLEQALIEMRLPAVNNLMTRFLCDSPAPDGVLPASAVEDAQRNLRQFAFIGIQERFEESIVLLQRMLGTGSVPYENRHVSSDRPAVEDLPDRDRELIAECNQLDAELYEFGVALFDDELERAAGHWPQ
jgi:hypothetical protein